MCSHSSAPQGYTYSYTYAGISYNAGDQVNRVTNVYDVYSTQTPITYSINWNCGANSTGNSGVSGTEHVNYASHYDLSTKCSANTGYTCSWKKTDNSTFNASGNYNVIGDTDVTYTCSPTTYQISFASGGTGTTCSGTQSISYGEVLPQTPSTCTVQPGYDATNCKYTINGTDYTAGGDTYNIASN